MTRSTATAEKPATIRDLATFFDTQDFPRWDQDTLRALPSNEEWAALANPHMVTVRIAAVLMTKEKSELLEVIEGLEKDEVDGRALVEDMVPRFHDTESFFKALLDTVEGAEMRLLAAACKKAVLDGAEGIDD